jgi:rare lipoprotein A
MVALTLCTGACAPARWPGPAASATVAKDTPEPRHTLLAALPSTPLPVETPVFTQTGSASWYFPKLQRRTASGEAFDGKALTAAHRSLPFGTVVRVTALSTGRSVKVRINDRGPFIRGRVLDVSAAAAETLGITQDGAATVLIEEYVSDQS